jgi:hypothetical protein
MLHSNKALVLETWGAEKQGRSSLDPEFWKRIHEAGIQRINWIMEGQYA